MNNTSIWTEFFRVICDSIIKASSNGKNHVGLMHCLVRLVKPMHAQHTDELVFRTWECAEAHQCISHRVAKAFSECSKFFRRIAQDHTTAGVDHRALRFEEEIECFTDLTSMSPQRGSV